MQLTKKALLSHIDLDYMIKLRRELHMNPELGFELPKTLALIRRELDALGIEYTEKYGKSSIVAYINRDNNIRRIGLRADTDALPIQETNDVPYKSLYDGRMHACGHDAHTAILLGVAKALYAVKDELNCRVALLFQPAEEGPGGARPMVEDGVCDEFDILAACHIDNRYDCGTIRCGRGAIFAACDGFKLEFFGRSAHAAYPQEADDAMAMGVKAYSDIQLAFSRRFGPYDRRIVNIGVFEAGRTASTVSDYCHMRGTIRTYDEAVRDRLFSVIERAAKNAANLFDGTCKLALSKGVPAIYNDAKAADLLLASAADTIGADNAVELETPLMCSEDFYYYTTHKPSVYYFLGTRNEEKGFVNMTHASNCDIDERALYTAAAVDCGFVFDNGTALN